MQSNESMSNTTLGWFIFFWIAFTSMNIYVYWNKPDSVIYDAAQTQLATREVPQRQNEIMYTDMLNKIQIDNCIERSDKEDNDFYSCPDGSKISMIKWTRSDRKGVVTRYYNPKGNLILIYGHPDDVH